MAAPTAKTQVALAPVAPEGRDGDCLRRLFVAALTEQSNGAWKKVIGYLSNLSESDRHELSTEPDIIHYMHRTLHYADNTEFADGHIDIIQSLSALFPGVLDQCRKEKSLSGSYNLPLSTSVARSRHLRRHQTRRRVVSLDSGLKKLLRYSPEQLAATFRGPRLQLNELVQAASAVSHELTLQTKTALSITHHPSPLQTINSTVPEAPKPPLSPVYHWQLEADKELPTGAREVDRTTKARKEKSLETKLHTAYDVIAAFATGSLKAGAESVYLNSQLSSPWSPYNLTVVPKTRANPDHYLISKFGILHVQPGGSSDLQSFADWLHEAGLFSLCQQIPYFRQFLLRKMFRCWYRNVCYCQFVRLYSEVDRVGLRFFPNFHEAVDKIHRLNTELLNIPTHTLTPLGGYSADALEKNAEEMEAKTHRLLQRYFKYCKRVVSEAINTTRMQTEQLEEEKKHKPFVSDSPISVQVAQHAELEHKLGVARYRSSRLTDFVRLAEQMMTACLLQLARQSARGWVEDTLSLNKSLDTDDGGTSITDVGSESVGLGHPALLVVELKSDERGGVRTEPTEDKIALLLANPLHNITSLLTSCSSPLTSGPAPTHITLPHLPAGEEVRDDNVKTSLTTAHGRTKYRPLIQALKGLNSGGNEQGSVPESSRARSRLEGVRPQGAEVTSREEEFSNPDSPLTQQRMQSRLQQDPVLQALTSTLQEVVTGLESEVSATCQHYSWLDQAHSLIARCRRGKSSEMSAQNFENVLGELHSVLYRISHLPPLLPTSHSLVTISTVGVASQLEPQLREAVSKLQRSLATQALDTATQLLKDATTHSQTLSSKRYDLEGFVQYARSLRESQAFHSREVANTQRVSDIHTTLRKYSIHTSEADRETMQRLQTVWREFEASLRDGEQFVETQTPIKAQGLQESISVLDEQLEQLLMSASRGDFVDPSAMPRILLTRLESIQQEMAGIRSRLLELSKWEEAITGKHNDLSRMFHCFDVMYARQELWKYRRQFDSCKYDWSIVSFKKLDITYVEQKVCEWWKVCGHLSKSLPPDDPVLEQWRESVELMHTNMPMLKLLASPALQTSHWHTIFAAFNEQYDSPQSYNLGYFLERDLSKFRDLISEVHCLASQQSRLREKFIMMERQWETKAIELDQISGDRYSFCLPRKSSQRQTTITFFDPSEATGRPGSLGLDSGRDHLHSVQDGESLRQEIEAAMLELKVMLASSHLGGLRVKVELLRSNLQQVIQLFSLLLLCQDQWRDLLELFLYMKPASRKAIGLKQLQSASGHFKEVMDSIHGDPRLFSLLGKSRGQKGARDLQGPELKRKLQTILKCMEELMAVLGPRLEAAVSHWPRLGYLSQRQTLKALATRGNPLPIIPLINRVFPSITTLCYVESSPSSDRDSSPVYQVTGVEGVLGERLFLVRPLPLEQKPAVEWLAGLEKAVQFSLASRLTDCLARLPHPLTGQPLTSEEGVLEWLRGNVLQNVLLALDIHWSRRLLQACSDNSRSNLQTVCLQLQRTLENAVQMLLRQTIQHVGAEKDGEYTCLISHVLRSVVICLRRKADFAQSLVAGDADTKWPLHLHCTSDQGSVEAGDGETANRLLRGSRSSLADSRTSSAATSRGSLTASRTSLTASRASLTASRASLTASRATSPRGNRGASLPGASLPQARLPAHLSPLAQYSSSQMSSPASMGTSRVSSPGDQLQISPPLPCTVCAGGASVVYGFEYYGPTPHVVMTPAMESGVVAIATAVAQYTISGVTESQKIETAKEVAKLLGRHHHLYACSRLTSPSSVLHLLHTALSCGSFLTLQSPDSLPTTTQLRVRHYLHSLQSVLASCFSRDTASHPQSAQQSESNDGRPVSNSCSSRTLSSRLDWYGDLPLSSSVHSPQSLKHMGHNLTASPLFGCCVILTGDRSSKLSRSNQYDSSLRGVACMKPDRRLVTEVLLSSYGFSTAYQMSRLLTTLADHLQSQLSVCGRGMNFDLPWLHRVVSLTAHLLHTNSDTDHHQSEDTLEMCVMYRAVLEVTAPLFPPDQTNRLQDIVSQHLPHSGMGGGGRGEGGDGEEGELVRAVEDEMRERHLQIQLEVTEKIVQLHRSVGQYSSTILLGPKSSGISTCYRTLSAAYKRMGKPPINIIVINPAAYSWEQLFGGYCTEETGKEQWTDGILTRLLHRLVAREEHREVQSQRESLQGARSPASHWVVLDGPLSPAVLDTLITLMADGLCLPNMERVTLPSSCHLLLKPGPLPSLSPGLLGSCGLLHWSCDNLTHEMLVDSWLDRAPTQHDLSGLSISFLGSVLQNMVPESVKYLNTVCSKHYGHLYTARARHRSPGVAETLSLLGLLSAMLERNCPTREGTAAYSSYGSRVSSSLRSSILLSAASSRCSSAVSRASSVTSLHGGRLSPLSLSDSITSDHGASEIGFTFSANNINSVEAQILSILAFAFIWSIGAYVPFSETDSFNEFALEQINDLPICIYFPDEGSVFNYYLDLQTYRFEPWSKRKGRVPPKHGGYVPTPELSRVAYVAEMYLSYGYNVMLLGEKGSGKTSFTEFLLQSNMSLTKFPITHSMSAHQLHTAISSKVTEVTRMDKMRWGSRKIGMVGQPCLFFLDDLHLSCHRDPLEGQDPSSVPRPPSVTEMASFAMRHRCLFGYPDDTLCHISNVQYIASCLPGHQYTLLTQLLGSFHPVPFFPPSDKTLHTIFTSSVLRWFKRFPNAALGEPETLAKALSAASVVTFHSVCARLQPSATHPQWFISLQHLMNVFKGLLLMPLDSKLRIHSQFGVLRHRGAATTSSYGSKSSLKRKKPSSVAAGNKSGRSVRLPPVKKESILRNKIKSELKGKKPLHDGAAIQATLHQLIRLWCHENTRVYADRMTDSKDRAWFMKLLETCIKYCFCGVRFEKPSGSTAARSVRPGRGVRGRGVGITAQSEGLNLSQLVADGVRADILQTLLPHDSGEGEGEGGGGGGGGEGGGGGGGKELIPFNQVIMRGEDVTALIFCKLPTSLAQSEESASADEDGATSSEEERGTEEKEKETVTDPPTERLKLCLVYIVYHELGDGQVLETMEKHLHRYSAHCARRNQDVICPAPDLILSQRAMEHAVRLSRVMIIPGCHALLLGVKGSGRKSLTRFVAYIMGAQLFEIGVSEDADGYKEPLKKACSSAATDPQSPAVLLISCAGQCRNIAMWSSISQVMCEGTCSGLFTNSELIRMQNILRKDRSKKAITAQTIAKLTQRNLHVVIAWDVSRTTESPISVSQYRTAESNIGLEEVARDVFSVLCRQCNVVDHYQTWGCQELSEVAQKWWTEKTGSLKQGWITSGRQLESLAALAAHVHLSSLHVLDSTSSHLSSLLLSPATFTQCLTMAHSIAITLQEKGKGSEKRLCSALEKIADAEEGERAMKAELAALEPELRAVETQLQERNRHIEACQEKFKLASQKCSEAKATIESETQTVEKLQQTVAEKMDQVSSLHSSSMKALSSVSKNDVLEVMSYREPPATAIPVFNSLCMLFDRPQIWEECKQLMLSPNFFESLKFFDKDSMSRHKLRQLRSMLRSPQWRVDSLQHASRAVSSVALWVAALLDYHHARDVVKPFKDKLAAAEKILTEAEVMFVAKQRDMLETKVEFRAAQRERGASLRQKTSIETKIAAVRQRLSSAGRLLSTLSPWKSRWEEDRAAIHTRTLSSPGHAVLAAANITYLSRLPADSHRRLWDGWLGYCKGRVQLGYLVESETQQHTYHNHQPLVQVEADFSPKNILSVDSEQSRWSHYASFPDGVTLERCIAARTTVEKPFSPLPLVMDPHQLFQHYAHELEFHRSEEHAAKEGSSSHVPHSGPASQPASCVVVLRVSSGEGWADTLCELEQKREQVVVLILDAVPSDDDGENFKSLLSRRAEGLRNSGDQTLHSGQLFRLYLVLEGHMSEAPSPILQSMGLHLLDFSVVDMELSVKALELHLLKLILRIEHPEYALRHRGMLVDRTLFEKQIEDSKEHVLVSVLESVHLLDCPYIADIVEESKHSELSALDHIQDTDKALGRSRGLVDSYRLLSLLSALVFSTAHKLCMKFRYRHFTLTHFQEQVEAILARYKNIHPPDNPAACHGYVLHLQKKILVELQHHLNLCMFQRHHILLPLLVLMAQLLEAGQISREEYLALGEDSGMLLSQLDVLAASGAVQGGSLGKPAWLSHQNWSDIHLLERLPVFQGLSSSVSSYSEGWQEYCGLEVCLTIPTPLHPTSPPSTLTIPTPLHPTSPPSTYHAMLLWRALKPEKFAEAVEEFVSLGLGPELTSWGTHVTPQTPLNHILSDAPPPPCTPVICLIHSEHDEDTAAGILRAGAVERGVAYHYIELDDMWDRESVSSALEVWSSEGGWVVIGCSHLQRNLRMAWQQLNEFMRENESQNEVQMWVIVPLPQSASVDLGWPQSASVDPGWPSVDPGWPCVVLEEHSTPHLTSKELMSDIRLAVNPDPSVPTAGSVHRLLTSLQQQLPQPLSSDEIADLSPTELSTTSQAIIAFLYNELQLINSVLLNLRASLQWMEECSAHPFQFSSQAAQAVAEIRENRVPQLWSGVLPPPLASLPSLMWALQLLRGGMEYLVGTVKSGRGLPVKLHPLWVSNPRDLMSRVQHCFAKCHDLPPSDVTLLAQVDESSSSLSQEFSLTFHSLCLCGATWDHTSSTLVSSPLPPSSPICVTLTPTHTLRAVQHTHPCPVYSTAGQQNTLFHIPFPTSPSSIQAFLHCQLDYEYS